MSISFPPSETLADRIARLGSVPLERIPMVPPPGTATEEHVLTTRPGGEKRLYELVDGMLVEKAMGFYEARLATVLSHYLERYLEEHDLGIVLGADGTHRLAPGLVRVPDVSFLSWSHFPGRELPTEQIPDLAPDLAVEILRPGNTSPEMERKRREYFAAGTRLVWIVDPSTRTARVYTSPDECATVGEDGALDGGNVLPGFRVSLREWFQRAGRKRSG